MRIDVPLVDGLIRDQFPRRHRPLHWVHADLHRGNLLFSGGVLTGVID